jgi:PRA1 family protein
MFHDYSVSQIQSRVTLDTIRPLPMFLGISGQNFCFSPEAFGPPMKKLDKSSPEKFKSRLRLNFSFFLSNYALVTAGVSLVIALMHPGMLLSLGFLWASWTFHHFLISNEVLIMGKNIGTLLSLNQRSVLLSFVTVVVVVWKCLKPTITAVAISGVLVLVHAILRDPKHLDTSSTSSHALGRRDSDDEGQSSDSEVMVERPLVRKDVV